MQSPLAILAAREAFEAPGTEGLYGPPLIRLSLFGLDASINRAIVLMMVVTVFLIVLFNVAFRKPKLVPTGLQNVMEWFVDFIKNNIVLAIIGPRGLRFLPYLTLLFFFIFSLNILGSMPFVNFSVTSRMAIPATLGVISLIAFTYAGVRTHGFRYFKYAVAPAGVPKPVLLFLVPIEFFSTFVMRPITLALRLCINMVVGHLILAVLFFGTAYLLQVWATRPLGIGTALLGAGFLAYEMFVAALQAFIFTILTSVYISIATDDPH